jgi:hypothetical protein
VFWSKTSTRTRSPDFMTVTSKSLRACSTALVAEVARREDFARIRRKCPPGPVGAPVTLFRHALGVTVHLGARTFLAWSREPSAPFCPYCPIAVTLTIRPAILAVAGLMYPQTAVLMLLSPPVPWVTISKGPRC